MARIDHAALRVDDRVIRVDTRTTLCSGLGTPVVRRGVHRWSAFDCTFTTFRGGIDRDLDFRVRVLGPQRYAVGGVHWVGEER